MALAMVCGYDEKRDNRAWALDNSQTSSYVRSEPWLGGTMPGTIRSWSLDTAANHNAENDIGAWIALPVRDSNEADKNVLPWLAMDTQASHKGPWFNNKAEKSVGLELETQASNKGPWLAPHEARTVSRSKRQIVMECCLKACSEDELMTYC
ncbi:uncharacterized protein LOC123690914 [Colias croceus]|uniref:uncharacterized protein LOC123690914 n=1 Tax=Colias crocea TaxID=72248 RepID=UPI001E27DF38|nr:uncharacterized protein LOC123690914 [Colias croceus]